MEEALRSWLDGKIDFQGQYLAERIQRDALIASTVVAFIAGYVSQSLSVSLTTFGGASAVVAVATVPAWPMYNQNALKWLPIIKSEDAKK